MSRPIGHMSTAGIVPVFLDADHIWMLHRYAAAWGDTTQDAAGYLLTAALEQWCERHPDEHPEPPPPRAA